MIKVLLTHAYYIAEDPAEQRLMMPYPPLGLLGISTWLDKQGLEHLFLDSTFSSPESHFSDIAEYCPGLLGIYVTHMTRAAAVGLIRRIRSAAGLRDMKILLGGPDVRYHQEEWIKAGADFLVAGEGEAVCAELIRTLDSGASPLEVAGLIMAGGDGRLISTAERKRLDPDILPIPDRRKLDVVQYQKVWREKHGFTSANLSGMRGCPYTCKWCSKAIYGEKVTRRSPALVVEEMKLLHAGFGFDRIWIVDDVFTINKRWLQEFSDILSAQNLQIPFEIISRADCLDGESVDLLKKSACYRVWVGAESGSDRVLEKMDRRVSSRQVQEAIGLLHQAGIEAGTFIMLGYPGEKARDIRATITHLKACIPLQFTLTLAYPIKGTALYEEVRHILLPGDPWGHSDDRRNRYRRDYRDGFYRMALSRIHHSIAFHQGKRLGYPPLRLLSSLVKSGVARVLMWVNR